MQINTDINLLGGLPDFSLITRFIQGSANETRNNDPYFTFTAIKTDKSVRRFERAITSTFLKSSSPDSDLLVRLFLKNEGISKDSLLLLFWNASRNNDLLNYLNTKVYFPAFYSGRVSIKNDEIVACMKDLKESEDDLKKWSEITITTTSSKYLTLLKKLGLIEGSVNKSITHPYLSDKMFVLFAYWLKAIAEKPNLLNSEWLQYSFNEKHTFIDRLLQKKFSKYFNVVYTGDKLSIEPVKPYESIYEHST